MRLSRNLINWVIAIALGGSLATYQMAPQWNAWWGLMDDTEYLGWAPRGQSLRIDAFAATLARTEIGRIGTTTRFRPIYYTLRVTERVMWPVSAAWYYAARTGMFALALSLCAWALFASMGRVIGAGVFAIVSSEWFWRDIWAHGGPAEQYASVGTSMLAVACALAWTEASAARARGIALLAAAGTVMAMGSKENFLILVVPCAIVLQRLSTAHKHHRVVMAMLVVVTVCAVAIIAALLPGLRLAGTDVYGNQVGAYVRLAWLGSATGFWLAAVMAISAVLPMAAWNTLARARRTEAARTRHLVLARRWYAQAGLLLLLFTSQLTFYAPRWPTFGSRYDLPGMLVLPLGFAALAVYLLRWLELAGTSARACRHAAIVISLVAVAGACRHDPLPVRSAAEENTRYTQALRAVLTDIVRRADRLGSLTPIIVELRDKNETEPAGSVMRLLYEVGSNGPFFLRLAPGAATDMSLTHISRNGVEAASWNGVTLQPERVLLTALEASKGVAMIVTLNGYALPRVREEKGL